MNNKGFTLVELAISVTVIGFLILGVVKGQSLLNTSRVATTLSKVSSYEGAMTSFFNIYDEYPGDMRFADQKIPACADLNCTFGGTSASPSNDGDNDRRIEGVSDVAAADNSTEGRGFWEHLTAAELISDTIVSPGTTNDWGVTHPPSPFGGGFTVMYNPATTGEGGGLIARGHFFRLSRNQAGAGTAGTALLTPDIAAAFDRKIDDDNPDRGRVIAHGASCKNAGVYTPANEGKNCALLFKFK